MDPNSRIPPTDEDSSDSAPERSYDALEKAEQHLPVMLQGLPWRWWWSVALATVPGYVFLWFYLEPLSTFKFLVWEHLWWISFISFAALVWTIIEDMSEQLRRGTDSGAWAGVGVAPVVLIGFTWLWVAWGSAISMTLLLNLTPLLVGFGSLLTIPYILTRVNMELQPWRKFKKRFS